MITWIVNIIGIVLIAFIVWWFWVAKPRAKQVATVSNAVVDIIVGNGIYQPNAIKLKAGEKVKLCFFRKDPSPCAEWVIFPKLNINDELPLNKPHTIEVKIDQPGEYEFTCQMAMYRGKLIVE